MRDPALSVMADRRLRTDGRAKDERSAAGLKGPSLTRLAAGAPWPPDI
jgi:hypothetical protein